MANETNGLFIKKCSSCGEEFQSDKKRARVCRNCQKIKKRELARERGKEYKKPKRVHTDNSLIEFVGLIERYNRENKTRYTYGQFVAAISEGKIDRRKLFD